MLKPSFDLSKIELSLQDGPKFMAEEAKLFNYPFPYLYDEELNFSNLSQDGRRPFELVYHGQFDDSRPSNNVRVTGRLCWMQHKVASRDIIPTFLFLCFLSFSRSLLSSSWIRESMDGDGLIPYVIVLIGYVISFTVSFPSCLAL
ncbi:hypothetical protein CK203_093752 [Vitis vinifera]|uniref:Uncharacterized protein n=1 Tax=Vitis vinifera TaxID=29760 RepID=A0A438DAQ7_VITVI|nr:hypothetical protein CK203_093752 [Vitis vinifera]